MDSDHLNGEKKDKIEKNLFDEQYNEDKMKKDCDNKNSKNDLYNLYERLEDEVFKVKFFCDVFGEQYIQDKMKKNFIDFLEAKNNNKDILNNSNFNLIKDLEIDLDVQKKLINENDIRICFLEKN